MDQLITDRRYIMERFPGKGGWTFVSIPEAVPNKSNPFGWLQVKGSIDGIPFQQYKLMPKGDGQLFFPVKKEIRKKLRKEEGDEVHIVMYLDQSSTHVPDELLSCFALENPELLKCFNALAEGEKKKHISHIYQAATESEQADRIVELFRLLEAEIEKKRATNKKRPS